MSPKMDQRLQHSRPKTTTESSTKRAPLSTKVGVFVRLTSIFLSTFQWIVFFCYCEMFSIKIRHFLLHRQLHGSSSFSNNFFHTSVAFLSPKKVSRIISISDVKSKTHPGSKRNPNDFAFAKLPSTVDSIVSMFPSIVQPYLRLMRLHSPTGAWLLLWPGYFSLGLAAEPSHFPHAYYLWMFGVGTILMRGVGCTVNDLIDKKLDVKVERTKNRPLANGDISVPKALSFLALQSSLALYILTRFDASSIILGLSSVGLVCIYPFAKKFTYWPQLVLGLTFNWGALLGWSVLTHGNPYLPGAIPLYSACVFWTLIYDTIYAHQDRRDDLAIGVKSTAIKFNDRTAVWLKVFSIGMFSNLALVGLFTEQLWPYYVGMLAAGLKMYSNIKTLDIDDPYNCATKFNEHVYIGWFLFLGIIASTLLKTPENINDLKLVSELSLENSTKTNNKTESVS